MEHLQGSRLYQVAPCSLQPSEFQGRLSFTFTNRAAWMLTTVYFKPLQCASNTHTPDYWALCSAISASLAAHPCTASGFTQCFAKPFSVWSHTRNVLPSLLSPVCSSPLPLSARTSFSYTPVSDFLTHWEMNCYFFWVLFAFCHLMQDCLQGPAHPTIPKFLLSALRPHDQIFTLASTSVGSLLPQSESISILRTPTARSTPDTSNGFRESVAFAYAFQRYFYFT